MGSLGGEGKNPGGGDLPDIDDNQMNDIMKQFTSFLGNAGEGNDNDLSSALNSVVKDIVSKESLYGPMKRLKDAFPEYLENNWQKLEDGDLERYNKQLDKVTEICAAFEREGGENPTEEEKT